MSEFALAVKWDLLPYINGDGLDIGCGDARPHEWMVGVDIKGGTTPRGPNHIRDARKLRGYFADESQDYVFSSYLLNELEDWPKVLADWWALVKPGGHLILFLPVIEEEGKRIGPYVNGKVTKSGPRMIVDAMVPLLPWQLVDAMINGGQFFQVYRKTAGPSRIDKPPIEKTCAVVKLGAHGDALWASSVFPHLKEQGYHTILYCQETTEEVLRHDPHIDQIYRFESRLPMGELGEFFAWIDKKYPNSRVLVEVVEGTLLPAPSKIQYHFPAEMRHRIMNLNYLEMHHMQARVPYVPRQKFYPNEEEKRWANELRSSLQAYVVVLVPNGSSLTKSWPYAAEFAKRLLEREDVSVVVLGDPRGVTLEPHPRLVNAALTWSIRQAMTFCQLANAVVGQETGLLNSVAFESEVRKVVLLTHSSHENLTRDWVNTVAIGKPPAACAGVPCHRLHYSMEFCSVDAKTKAAACQAAISVDDVLREIMPALRMEQAA